MLTSYQAKYFGHELTKRSSSEKLEKLSQSLFNATVDMNPHQVEAALFAFRSPLSRGALLADEVELGKTIEAGLIISQLWAERRRRILIIVPTSLRKQWNRELIDKFFIASQILETRSFNLLKSVLDYLALRYRGRVPRQSEPRYTIGDLINAVDKELKKRLRVEKVKSCTETGEENLRRHRESPSQVNLDDLLAQGHLETETVELRAVLDEINGLTWIRNMVGGHFNWQGANVTDTEVKRFADATMRLVTALACEACGELPSSDKTGNYWACRCKRTRLFPPKVPT
ncbi:MAG: SNF2-related protein [Pyrinomonadaceae bacterium]